MFEVRKTPKGWGVYNLSKHTWKSYNTTNGKVVKQLNILNKPMHTSKKNGAGYKIML